MSGPPYPHPNPAPGSNAIGQFKIGVSPIGTIPSFDVWKTVISQYANSPVITAIIENFSEDLDQTANFDNFYDYVWNVATARGRGLDILGRIVNVSRILQVPGGNDFGFEEAVGGGIDTFGAAPFYSGEKLTGNYALSDASYRLLVAAKAAFNITDGSVPSINKLLLSLFPGRGNCFVAEGYPPQSFYFGFEEAQDCQPFGQAPFFTDTAQPPMSLTYVFEFFLSPVELAIVSQSGAIPKPTGVKARVLQTA